MIQPCQPCRKRPTRASRRERKVATVSGVGPPFAPSMHLLCLAVSKFAGGGPPTRRETSFSGRALTHQPEAHINYYFSIVFRRTTASFPIEHLSPVQLPSHLTHQSRDTILRKKGKDTRVSFAQRPLPRDVC